MASGSTYGVLSTFDHLSQEWNTFKTRLNQWFIANDITSDTDKAAVKQRAILITSLSESTFKLVSDLALPDKVVELEYGAIVKLLDDHFTPKRFGFAEKSIFYAATQRPGETHTQWAARIRGLAAHCAFKNLEETLLDKFIMGMAAGHERDKLFVQDQRELTLAKAIDLAESVRCARQASSLVAPGSLGAGAAGPGGVFNISKKGKCSVCGFNNHTSNQCRFKNYKCKKCNTKGHLRKMCPNEGKVKYVDEGNVDDGDDDATPCTEDTCPGLCRRSPSGPQCSCPRGLKLAADGRACDDVDECVADVCAHNCINTHGSFICSCYPGYALRSDRRSCKAVRGNMSVLYVSGNSVKSIFTDYKVSLEYNDPNIARITDLDYNVRKNQLYVAAAETGKLIEVNRTQDELGINVITNVGRPTRVAVDWVTDNVYFADSFPGRSCLRVCSVKKKRCARLQKLPSDAVVSALVVDPASRKMFYCVNRELESIVRSASLSGRQVADLATITNCTGLEVDSFKQRLYVAETGPSRILQMDFEGNTLKTIFANDPNLQAPHGLVIFEDSIYFIGANSFKLSRCHLHEPRVCEPYLYSVFDANTFVIRHESVQRDDVTNDCDTATCANVCVLGDTEPQCVCDDGGISSDGSCPRVLRSELALFNGWSQQDAERAHSVSLTLVGVVLALLLLYLAVFAYYQRARRAARGDYVQ